MNDNDHQKDPATHDAYCKRAASAPFSVKPPSKGSSEPTNVKNPAEFRIPTITDACPAPIGNEGAPAHHRGTTTIQRDRLVPPLKNVKPKADKYESKGSSDLTSQHKPKGPSGSTCRPLHTLVDLTGRDYTTPSVRTGPSGPKKARPAGGLPIWSAESVVTRGGDASIGSRPDIGETQTFPHAKAEPEPSKQRTRDHMVLPIESTSATLRRNEPSGSPVNLVTLLNSFTLQPPVSSSSWSIRVPGPNKTGWEPLEDCRDHVRDERPHLRIEDAVPCFKTICKVKGGRRPQCAAAIGRLSISSLGKMYAILWASRHHLKPKSNPLDASEIRQANEVVLDFINTVVRSRSSELPEIVNRYFDAIRDGFTDDPFMPYDFQTAVMRWQEGCPTAAAFLKAHPSGSIYFQPVFLNRCRRDIREAYLRVAEPGLLEAIEWTRMRNYQVLMQFQRPWTPLRELGKTTKDCVVKVHVNQDNIVQEERIMFTDSSGLRFYDDPRLSMRVIRLCDVPAEAFAEAKKYFMGHLVQRVYWSCSASRFNDRPEDCGRLIRKVSNHFYRRFPHIQLYTAPVPDSCRTQKPVLPDSSESNVNLELEQPSGSTPPNEDCDQETKEPYGSNSPNQEAIQKQKEPSGSTRPTKEASHAEQLPPQTPAMQATHAPCVQSLSQCLRISSQQQRDSLNRLLATLSEDSNGDYTRRVMALLRDTPGPSGPATAFEQPAVSTQEKSRASSDAAEQVASSATTDQSIDGSAAEDANGSLTETSTESQRTDNEEKQSHKDELF